jgi:hypothetical protein
MKRATTLTIAALFCAAAPSHATDLYFDLNGTDPGFNVTSTNDPHEVNFTNATWNTDSTGGAGGILTTVSDGDILHFGLEHTGGNLFNWSYYTNVTVGGIHTYQTAGSTASINRFQKNNADGAGFQPLRWAPGAFFNTEKAASLWWNLGTFGDFEKVGNQWLIFSDGGVKVNGTCTISTNNVIVRNLVTIDNLSSFKLNGGELRFDDNLDDGGAVTANVGKLLGSGSVTRDGTANALNNLTVNFTGANMTNNTSDKIQFAWGIGASMTADATTDMEITKTGGTNYSDQVTVDWGSRTLDLNGDLNVTLLPGSETLVAGDSFDLFSDNLSGGFDNIDLPNLGDPGLIWSTAGLTASGVISVAVADTNAPSTPTGLSAISNVYTVSLDWDNNPEPTVTGYKVYRSETSGSGFAEIADVSVSEYHDSTTIPNDITYYYKVAAYNFVATEGLQSAEESTTVLFNLRNGDFELPALASGGTSIDANGDWTEDGSQQGIQKATWASEPEVADEQGAWMKGWNKSVTNSFYQDKTATSGVEYNLDAGFKVQDNFRANGGQVEMALVWLDGGSAEISRDSLDIDAAISTNTWAHTNVTAVAPSGSAMVRALFYWTTTTNAGTGSGEQSCMVDNATLTRYSTPSAYDTWASTFSLTEGPDGHDDSDGLANLSEYALGGDPTNANDVGTTPKTSIFEDGDTNTFEYVHVRRTDPNSGIAYHLLLTENLVYGQWATNTGFVVTGVGPDVDGFDTVTNRTSTTEAQKFIKLLIEQD